MKVFVAGATGALGKQLVPMLVEPGARGHGDDPDRRQAGSDPRRWARRRRSPTGSIPRQSPQAVAQAEPEVVIHELTAIDARPLSVAASTRCSPTTNRLRTEGTDHLLAAAKAAGAQRFIAQSFAGWPYKRVGGPVKTEEDPLHDDAAEVGSQDRSLRSSTSRTTVTGADGIEGIALALRRLLRPRDLDCRQPGRRAGRDDPEAPLPDRRQRRRVWSLVHIAGRRRGDRRRAGTWGARRLQRG